MVSKALPRLTLFGAMPPSILPVLLSIRKLLDVHKSVDRKLLRLTYYMIQLACGDGSAGTTLPFSPLTGEGRPPRVRVGALQRPRVARVSPVYAAHWLLHQSTPFEPHGVQLVRGHLADPRLETWSRLRSALPAKQVGPSPS
jgi:hypothetical protein